MISQIRNNIFKNLKVKKMNKNSIKKAVVTGGAGFIGNNLIESLLRDGVEVISIDDYSAGKKEEDRKN